MKKVNLIIIALGFLLSLSGCMNTEDDNNSKGEPGITGYVMDIEEGRILVVDSKPQDFSDNGGIGEFYNAIWFAKAPDDIKVGDEVKVWFDFIMESYPGQSEVVGIERVVPAKPDGANLDESEVLNKALTSGEVVINSVLAVKSIEFNSEIKVWSIVIKDIMNNELFELEVEDI